MSSSQTTHQRLQLDPSEWYLCHTLYREARATWAERPVDRIANRIRVRPDWVVGDFGCGECLLQDKLPNKVIGIDHVAAKEGVIACDMAQPLWAMRVSTSRSFRCHSWARTGPTT